MSRTGRVEWRVEQGDDEGKDGILERDILMVGSQSHTTFIGSMT